MARDKKLTARERNKRFSEALQELRKTMSPEELEELREGKKGLGLVKGIYSVIVN